MTNWEDLVGLEGVTAVQEAHLQSLSFQTLAGNILFKFWMEKLLQTTNAEMEVRAQFTVYHPYHDLKVISLTDFPSEN